MILLGCLLAFGAAVAPRVILVLAWIFSDRWARVWEGDFLVPLLGIIFLPYTTIMYMLAVTVTPIGGASIEGIDWIWVLLGLILDLVKWGHIIANRRAGQEYASNYYPAGAPGASTIRSDAAVSQAAVSTGQVAHSADPTATDVAPPTRDDPPSSGSTSSG